MWIIGLESADDHKFLQDMSVKTVALFSRPDNGVCHRLNLEPFGKIREENTVMKKTRNFLRSQGRIKPWKSLYPDGDGVVVLGHLDSS